jgi:hypothetical protein
MTPKGCSGRRPRSGRRRPGGEAAHLSGVVETHLAGFDQALAQPDPGALEAGLGAREREPQSLGQNLLRLALDVAQR